MNELNTNYNCTSTRMSAPPPYREDSDADGKLMLYFLLKHFSSFLKSKTLFFFSQLQSMLILLTPSQLF